jgi:hypothetical protein
MKSITKVWIYPLALMLVLLIITGSCKKKDNNDIPTIAIGSTYAGGIIFSIDTTGKHGLVCAPKDQGYGVDWVTAAQICSDYSSNGYNDWYLPSIGELWLMYSELYSKGIGGFSSSAYWSATQATVIYAWYVDFHLGYKGNGPMGAFINVRAVRAF